MDTNKTEMESGVVGNSTASTPLLTANKLDAAPLSAGLMDKQSPVVDVLENEDISPNSLKQPDVSRINHGGDASFAGIRPESPFVPNGSSSDGNATSRRSSEGTSDLRRDGAITEGDDEESDAARSGNIYTERSELFQQGSTGDDETSVEINVRNNNYTVVSSSLLVNSDGSGDGDIEVQNDHHIINVNIKNNNHSNNNKIAINDTNHNIVDINNEEQSEDEEVEDDEDVHEDPTEGDSVGDDEDFSVGPSVDQTSPRDVVRLQNEGLDIMGVREVKDGLLHHPGIEDTEEDDEEEEEEGSETEEEEEGSSEASTEGEDEQEDEEDEEEEDSERSMNAVYNNNDNNEQIIAGSDAGGVCISSVPSSVMLPMALTLSSPGMEGGYSSAPQQHSYASSLSAVQAAAGGGIVHSESQSANMQSIGINTINQIPSTQSHMSFVQQNGTAWEASSVISGTASTNYGTVYSVKDNTATTQSGMVIPIQQQQREYIQASPVQTTTTTAPVIIQSHSIIPTNKYYTSSSIAPSQTTNVVTTFKPSHSELISSQPRVVVPNPGGVLSSRYTNTSGLARSVSGNNKIVNGGYNVVEPSAALPKVLREQAPPLATFATAPLLSHSYVKQPASIKRPSITTGASLESIVREQQQIQQQQLQQQQQQQQQLQQQYLATGSDAGQPNIPPQHFSQMSRSVGGGPTKYPQQTQSLGNNKSSTQRKSIDESRVFSTTPSTISGPFVKSQPTATTLDVAGSQFYATAGSAAAPYLSSHVFSPATPFVTTYASRQAPSSKQSQRGESFQQMNTRRMRQCQTSSREGVTARGGNNTQLSILGSESDIRSSASRLVKETRAIKQNMKRKKCSCAC